MGGEFEATSISQLEAFKPEDVEKLIKSIPDFYKQEYHAAYPHFFEVLETPRDSMPDSIDVMDLSLRAYNVLRRAQVDIFVDLVNKSLDDLRKIRNINEKVLEAICEEAKNWGIVFKIID